MSVFQDIPPGSDLLIRVRTRASVVGDLIPYSTLSSSGWCERGDVVAVLPSSGGHAVSEAEALKLLAGLATGPEIHPSA